MPKQMVETVQTPETVLNSGHRMPLVGLGSATHPVPPLEDLMAIFMGAMKVGYRHFDTAALHGTEEALGKAVSQAIKGGLVNSREEFFITSKLWCTDADHDLVMPALRKTLVRLGLDYLDLYLVHFPIRMKQDIPKSFNPKDDLLPFDMHGTWKAMEDCNKLGLAKSIGVSNFTGEKLSELLQNSTIPPAVNQVEMNVTWQQRKLLPFCQQKGIHVSAWFPLGGYSKAWGSNAVIESPVLNDIASFRSKSVAQIALRWIYEQGARVIVKSFNKERMIQNLQIFSFQLSEEEVSRIQEIPQRRCYSGDSFIHSEGLIKSLEELWDGDM